MTTQSYFPVPIDSNWKYSSGYGPRNAPKAGASTYHQGVDIKVPVGTSVIAVKSGTIVYSGWQDPNNHSIGFGQYIKVKNDDGSVSYYGHLSKLDAQSGRINAGQTIAKSGNTGTSSGPHLHYGEKSNGSWINPKPLLEEARSSSTTSSVGQTFTANLSPEIEAIMNSNYPTDADPIMPNSTEQQTQTAEQKAQTESFLKSEDMKQTTTFLTELNLQLPYLLPTMIARLAMGEDLGVVSADMATRLIATSAINTYAENNPEIFTNGKNGLEASTANAIASYAAINQRMYA